jgi:N6-L-threonylcarbamoyladenine synthase
MTILGIETSCDETAVALIETREQAGIFECRVIGSLIHSQAELHSAYGGVFPSLAKREHGKNLVPLLHTLLKESKKSMATENGQAGSLDAGNSGTRDTTFKHSPRAAHDLPPRTLKQVLESFRGDIEKQNPDLYESLIAAEFLEQVPPIDRIAVTEGPGLEPTLWVGINFARILSRLWRIPIIPVNHMEGHVIGSLLKSDVPHGEWQSLAHLPTPAIALLISGGHTELVKVTTAGGGQFRPEYEIIGHTKDDAVGEAFDKAARLLGLPYPGGPHISKLSQEAEDRRIASPVKLPRPMLQSGDLNFSFSGLKTALLYAVRDQSAHGSLDEVTKKGLVHEFELAVTETLEAKLHAAIEQIGAQSVIIGGGVSANKRLRDRFTALADEFDIPIFMPSHHISGDNALMIALAGSLHANEASRELKAAGTLKLAE